MADALRSKAISDAIDAGKQYDLNQTDAAALLARVDNEFYLRGDENGGLVIDGYNYYDCDIAETNQTQALFDAVHEGKTKQECLDALGNEADWNVESYISGRMHAIVDDWMRDKGYELTKEENWELQDAAFDFLNDQIAIDYDRSYEHQEMRVNIIVATAGDITVGSEDNPNKRTVQSFIKELVEDQGHTMDELNAAFDEYSDTILLPAFSDGRKLYQEQSEKNGKFIASLASEIANSNQFNVDEFVFLTKLSVEDYARLGDEDATITFPAGTMCGMYNRYDGSGSVLEVELEKEITIPRFNIPELQIESRKETFGYHYNVDEVYGLTAQCWDKGKAEVHDLSELDRISDIEVHVSEHSEGYYSGTVTLNGDVYLFEAKENEYGDGCEDVELHNYSEPGWITGACYEKPLPEEVTARYEDIVEAVTMGIDEFERDEETRSTKKHDDIER